VQETPRILRSHTASLEIADTNDGHAGDDGADKCPRPFASDVFVEDDVLVREGQPPTKQRRRAQSVSSSVRPGEVWTPLVVDSRHNVGPDADLKHDETMSDDHEWHAYGGPE